MIAAQELIEFGANVKRCRYCRKKITNNDNHGWVGKDGFRRCFSNNEVMLKEHVPMPDLTWRDPSAKMIYTKQPIL